MIRVLLIALLFFTMQAVAVADQAIADKETVDILQWLLNIAFTLVGILGGWILKFFHERITAVEATDEDIYSKVHLIELLVTGQYVKKEELDKLSVALFTKLDRIENKLDGKVDKDLNHGFYKG
jgi:hypothetical protein